MRKEYGTDLYDENELSNEYLTPDDFPAPGDADSPEEPEEYFVHEDEYNDDYSPELIEDEDDEDREEDEDDEESFVYHPFRDQETDHRRLPRRSLSSGRSFPAGILTAFLVISITAVLFLVSGLPGSALSLSRKIPEKEHEHTIPAEWTVVLAADCLKAGRQIKVCPDCGETVAEEEIPALGHESSGEWVTEKDADCLNPGIRRLTCSVCGEEIASEEIPPLGHTEPSEWTYDGEDSSCVTGGHRHKACTLCGEILEEEDVPPLGHVPSDEWTVDQEPTCEEEGRRVLLCSVCGSLLLDGRQRTDV